MRLGNGACRYFSVENYKITNRCSLQLVVYASMALCSCEVGPDYISPSTPENAGYSSKIPYSHDSKSLVPGDREQMFEQARDVPGQWWELFHSRQISAFVKEAIENHPDIAAAEFALRQAREVLAADETQFLPQFRPAYGANPRNAFSINPTSFSGPSNTYLYRFYTGTVSVGYSPDIYGRVRRTIESDQASVDYQKYQLEAAHLSLTANVVGAVIRDAQLAGEIALTNELIDICRKKLALAEKRFKLGAIDQGDVLGQQTFLAQTEATLPPLEKSRAQNRNALMSYLGRFPNQDTGESVSLDSLRLPAKLPLSLPSKLVRQRPDIMSAESRLHEASAAIGIATANMLPQITLAPNIGLYDFAFAGLYAFKGVLWGLGGQTSGSIFDGGGGFQQREAAISAYQQETEKYKSVVINAFKDVSNSLRAIESDAKLLRTQEISEKVAKDNFKIVEVQYNSGSKNLADLLSAGLSLFRARLDRLRAQSDRYSDTVALVTALGGGWWNRVDETPRTTPTLTDPIGSSPVAAAVRAQMGLGPDRPK